MFYINSQCDYLSTSISPINRHQSHQCDYLGEPDVKLDHVVIDANGLIIWEIVGSCVIDANGLID